MDDDEWTSVEKATTPQRGDVMQEAASSSSSPALPREEQTRERLSFASPTAGSRSNSSSAQLAGDAEKSKFEEKIGPFEFSRAKWDAMVAALKVAKWHETRHQVKIISNVMSGEELCVWFVSNGYVASNEEAIVIGNFLIKVKTLYPMLKRLAPRGFENVHDLFYMLTPEREEKNVVAGFFDRKAKAAAGGVSSGGNDPVQYVADGYQVVAYVKERERFGHLTADDKLAWSPRHLLPDTDPRHFSMKLDAVPIPSVGAASPDLCEWIDEWAPLVKKGVTDEEGWIYAEGFAAIVSATAAAAGGGASGNSSNNNSNGGAGGSSSTFNIHEHRARERQWHRAARKIPDETQITVEEEQAETKKEFEERVHREMLERIEQARKARQKHYFQWTVVSASLHKALAPATAFVVVEHFATRHRSNAVPQRPSTDPNMIDFPINDCSGQFEVQAEQIVGVAMWANLSMGRKQQLGYASFCVPERSAATTEVQEETAEIVDKQNKTIGSVRFEWQMNPIPMDDVDDSNAKPGSLLHTPHCVLELSIVQISKVDFRILDRSRGSRYKCLAFFMPGGEPKAFLRIKYRGLVSNMTLESPRVLLTETTRFDFATFLPVRHLVPVQVELWYERGAPGEMTQEHIGEVKLEFVRSGLEMISNEKPVITPHDLSKKMYQQAMDALPPAAKPAPPPVPANPMLEDLISFQEQIRKSHQEKTAKAGGGTIYDSSSSPPSSPTAAAAAAAAAATSSASNAGDGTKSENGGAGGASPSSPQQNNKNALPSMIVKTCEMMIRYKYVVEGEAAAELDLSELTGGGAAAAAAAETGGKKDTSAAAVGASPKSSSAAAPAAASSAADSKKEGGDKDKKKEDDNKNMTIYGAAPSAKSS